ncbi:hypothetical protein [Pseudarthrobacter siccitolerans]
MKSHAAGATDHADSTTAIFLHAATAAVWVGGVRARTDGSTGVESSRAKP